MYLETRTLGGVMWFRGDRSWVLIDSYLWEQASSLSPLCENVGRSGYGKGKKKGITRTCWVLDQGSSGSKLWETNGCGLSYICKVSTPLHTTHLTFPPFNAYKVLECNVLLGIYGIKGVKQRMDASPERHLAPATEFERNHRDCFGDCP